MAERDETSAAGLCECGCGRVTEVNPRNDTGRGYVMGEHRRFICGHSGKRKRETVLYDVDAQTGCWKWRRNITRAGYGRYTDFAGNKMYAHRWMYEKLKGPIPVGLELDHKITCPKRCVNPDHLEAVTGQVNVQRGRIAKLFPDAILDIRSSPLPARVLATRYGVDRRQIYYVRNRQTWSNIKENEHARTG